VTARVVARSERLRGEVRVPGDKSFSHRALILSALADGTSTIVGLSGGHDVAASGRIVDQLGAARAVDGDVVTVRGPSGGLRASPQALDCANSGTSMRLLCGVVSAIVGRHRLVGDASLSRRPMERVARPLSLMGARVTGHGPQVNAPLDIEGRHPLRAIDYHVPVPSAQVKSAILLAGLGANGHTVVTEQVRTRCTTEDMLVHAGLTVHSVDRGRGRSVTLTPGRPRSRDWRVPGDPSQAAFFAVLGAVHHDAQIEVAALDRSRERIGFVGVLQRMGAHVSLEDAELGARLRSSSSRLHATEVWSREIPSVDEVPALVVAASAAEGVSAFRDMSELRVKESDRFAGAMELATALGCRCWSEGDDLFVEGLGSAERFAGVALAANLDHRMVMAAAVAGVAGHGAAIEGAETVASSYPAFFDDLASLE
jgi:3-phosphoshikimate 1-carboxyvinyltransferase